MSAALPEMHPLLARLVARGDCIALDESGFEDFVRRPGETLLFFAADPQRVRETLDLAVILPELLRAVVHPAARPVQVGLLAPDLAQRHAARHALARLPALVFLRGGEYLGAIEGLRDWAEYLRLADELLVAPARPLPAKRIAVSASGACD
jgi:hydrogenase-1 operon protein HyaE